MFGKHLNYSADMWYNGDMVLQAKKKFGLPQLAAVTGESIKSAGERYFLNRVRGFPNMPIKEFDDAVKGLIGGDEFHAIVDDIKKNIQKAWHEADRKLNREYPGQLPEPYPVFRGLKSLAGAKPGFGTSAFASIRKTAGDAHKKAKALSDQLHKEMEKNNYPYWGDEKMSLVSRYESEFYQIENFLPQKAFSRISGILPYMRANASSVHETGALILCSEWGMGKTHSLCFLAEEHNKQGRPVLLVLAKDFDPGKSPGDALALHTGLAKNFDELLQQLNALGRKRKERALLLVDGINERNPNNVWAKELGNVLQQAGKFPFVGVVVSYRYPFNPKLPEEILGKISFLSHPGFREIPFKAQAAFLEYYKIPTTDIPLMAEEFTRPLMLKMFCGIFHKLSKKEKRKGFAGFASGQKGMTFILERYIKERANIVMKKYKHLKVPKGWKKSPLWHFVKNKMASYMAEHMTEEVRAAVVLNALCESFSIGRLHARKMLRDMEKEGVVTKWRGIPRNLFDYHHTSGKPRWGVLVGVPYQRFSDHLIARGLFDRHLNKPKSVAEVRRCFDHNRPLGRIFTMQKDIARFRYAGAEPGVAEALILEFPERVKTTPGINRDRRELLFYLPRWKEKIDAYCGPFFRGLYWREKTTISPQTVRLADAYLNWEEQQLADASYSYHDVIGSLFSAACRHDSLLSSRWLYLRIKSMKMPERDIKWGAAIRRTRTTGWANNLLLWLSQKEADGFKEITPEAACNYIAILSLFLGTTDRPLRDKVTKALVAIGEKFSFALFSHALDTLGFDDIYYPERMLTACYGVAMSQWDVPDAKEFCREFPGFARKVVKDVFMPGGRLLTHHALVRDYALGIADVARKLGVKFHRDEERHMSPPFPAVPPLFPAPADIDANKFNKATWAFTPDFHDRYTVPYISPDGKFPDISRQIKWRVMDLGYTNEKFSAADRAINQSRGEQATYGKIDRCGKKYSWIAYHEMCGDLDCNGQLPSHIRRVFNAIDPSFPIPPSKWHPEFKIPSMDGSEVQWFAKAAAPEYGHILELKSLDDLPGPWVMLEGDAIHRKAGSENLKWNFSNDEDKNLRRDVFSFLRGLLVHESDIPRLQSALRDSEYPGNYQIPDCLSKAHVFGGEIPWSPNFISPDPDEENQSAFGIPVQTTAVCHRGNMYHGERFMFSEAWYPTADICVKLGLSRRGRGVDLVDKKGNIASLYRADDGHLTPNPFESQREDYQFLYLRKDLLDEYLRVTGKRLVWIIWGERRLLHDSEDTPEMLAARRERKNVHKKLCVYPL